MCFQKIIRGLNSLTLEWGKTAKHKRVLIILQKTDKLGHIKTSNFCSSKVTIIKTEMLAKELQDNCHTQCNRQRAQIQTT